MNHCIVESQQILPVRTCLLEEEFIRGNVLVWGNHHAALLLRTKWQQVRYYDPWGGESFPTDRYDTVFSFDRPESAFDPAKNAIVIEVSALLASGGRAYFVKSDRANIQRRLQLKGEEANIYWRESMLFKEIRNTGETEIYEYMPYTEIYQGNEKASPFFAINEERQIMTELGTVFAIYDKYPVSPGHALISPERVFADYFYLPANEQEALSKMVAVVKRILDASFKPDGYNIGINAGEAAGRRCCMCIFI